VKARIQRPVPVITVDLTELRIEVALDLPGTESDQPIHQGDWVTVVVRDAARLLGEQVVRLLGQVELIRRDSPYELGAQPHTIAVSKFSQVPPDRLAVERPS
jgi:hypothetical protein